MKHNRRQYKDAGDLIDDYRIRQQNVVWPSSLRNGLRADRFLWNGSPNPICVQRVGACIMGTAYFWAGLMFLCLALRERGDFWSVLILITTASLCLVGGIGIFRNGSPRTRTTPKD